MSRRWWRRVLASGPARRELSRMRAEFESDVGAHRRNAAADLQSARRCGPDEDMQGSAFRSAFTTRVRAARKVLARLAALPPLPLPDASTWKPCSWCKARFPDRSRHWCPAYGYSIDYADVAPF